MNLLKKWDYFKYRFKYRYGKYLDLDVPVDVSLELSSQCNMKCAYCYHADQTNLPFTKGIMDKSIAFMIIEEAAELGVNSLKMNWKGESTINPHFADVTAYAKRLAKGSTFIERLTNSNFKFQTSKDHIFEGLANQTKVKVSYDSFSKDVFETQRAGGDHDLTTKNIDVFYNHPARIKSGTEIVIQAVRTKLNKDEDIEGLCKKRWPDATISIRDMVEGRVNKDLDGLTAKKRDLSDRQSCLQAHVRIIFNHKGKAFPCCPDIEEKLCLGDIHQNSLRQIFNSALAKKLRQDLLDKKAFEQNPCASCSSFETYKGFKPVWNS